MVNERLQGEKHFSSKIYLLEMPCLEQPLQNLWPCIKPGIQEWGTECGKRGEWWMLYSGECRQTFQGML